MNITKHEWTLILSLIFISWLLDYSTKAWALSITQTSYWGPFGFTLHRNPGAMLGMFSDLPPLLRVVSLSTGGAFLIFIYSAFQYILPKRSITLRIGMSLLLGGILGNVTDRILWGSVIDFLLLKAGPYVSPAFNMADAIQWVGYAIIVYTLIRHGDQLWPAKEERKQKWVNTQFQLKYIFTFLVSGVCFSIISGVYSYTFLKVTISDLVPQGAQHLQSRFTQPFLFTFVIISVGFLVALCALAKILSHRIAGPLYAFEKYLDDMVSGKKRSLKLRSGDDFIHLQDIASELEKKLNDNFDKKDQENS